ncbi:MAG: fructose-bisphosphatase class III [Coriobacteriia bacterium]|nr:fructose-bisphosphatase class III [Coriobacteriia bacterium]MBS5477381.1 fructose-bisphosphatase class III [Coriobacteriia bacterium]
MAFYSSESVGQGELALPKPPMHFVSDIHGEAEAFRHLLRSCSGELRRAIARALDEALDSPEVNRLYTLLCYPRGVVAREREAGQVDRRWWRHRVREACRLIDAFCRVNPASNLVCIEMNGDLWDDRELCSCGSAKERSEAMTSAESRGMQVDELGARAHLHILGPYGGWRAKSELILPLEDMRALVFWATTPAAQHAYGATVDGLVEQGYAEAVLAQLAAYARQLVSGRLHMVGDIWDRGARGDIVLDELMTQPEVDVQWGNHDVCWMGAAAGDPACIATVLRNNLKYGNVAKFEEGYGISLDSLREFASATYADEGPDAKLSPVMKAISVLLFKAEGQAIRRHPEWHMEGRLLLDKIDLATGTVRVGEAEYPLITCDFPTLTGVLGAPDGDPYAFTQAEQTLMDELVASFTGSGHLQKQVMWLYLEGEVYRVADRYLLIHGCVPLNGDGTFAEVACDDGETRSGKDLLDWTDMLCRRAWKDREQRDLDWMGFFWTGWQSTFMGRVVKTFERTYIADESTWKEPQDPYYTLTNDDPELCGRILAEFGVDPQAGVIVNGHTPVKLPKGQLPVRSEGRRLVIDGGFCKAYRKSTGIAGYTLIDDANGARLVAHGDFPGLDAVLNEGADTTHEEQVLVEHGRPQQIGETPGTKRRLSAYPGSREDNDWEAKGRAQIDAWAQDWARSL